MQKANILSSSYRAFTSAEDSQGYDDITKPPSDQNAGLPGEFFFVLRFFDEIAY
jgi:hypothetical protein